MRKYNNEIIITIVIIIISGIIGLKNDEFFTLTNVIDILRSSIVMGIFVIAAMLVIISGGIDVSFTAIASFCMFSTTKILILSNYKGSIVLVFMIAGAIGIILGLINAVLISFCKLPTLIATLGTSSIYSGFMLTFIGAKEISNLPKVMTDYSKLELFTVTSKDGISSGLSFSFIIFVLIILAVAFILKFTMLGRGIYAIGGDEVAAARAGFNIVAIKFFIYGFVGFISGIAGIVHTCLMRNCNPINLMGTELLIIAAVIIGGARISGGYGSVIGSLLGLLLVVVIYNNLILLGIPSYWQKSVIGALILVGSGIAAYHNQFKKKALNTAVLN